MILNNIIIIIFNYSVASYNDYSCKLSASLKLRSVLVLGWEMISIYQILMAQIK